MVLHKDKENFDIAIRATSRHFNVSPAIIKKNHKKSIEKLLSKPATYEEAIKALEAIIASSVFLKKTNQENLYLILQEMITATMNIDH